MRRLILLVVVAAVVMADEGQVATHGHDEFTFKFFNEVANKNKAKSIIMSAHSLLNPLAQIASACEPEAEKQILNAIGYQSINEGKTKLQALRNELRSVEGVQLDMAAKIYVAENSKLDQHFTATARESFESEIQNIDFTKSNPAADEINGWVMNHTNNRIKDLVSASSLTADTRVLLVNAIYFKGQWKQQFEAKNTKMLDFHVTSQKTIKVPMMHIKHSFLYGESAELDAKLLQLPYKGDQASLLVVLPNSIDGIDALTAKLQNSEALSKAEKNMYSVEVDVALPKFIIETKIELIPILEALGVKKIFDPTNSGITNLLESKEPLFISEAIQKAFIEVNEEGAEATAANDFIAVDRIWYERKSIKFDRPFNFFLKYNSVIIFEGQYCS